MVKRIEQLTPEQEARMDPYAQEWIERALNPRRADRAKVESGIRRCYQLSDLEPPEFFIWVDSPLAGAKAGPLTAARLNGETLTEDELKRQVRETWSGYLGGQMWAGWDAWRAFFVDECDLELENGAGEKLDAWLDANDAGWWWPWDRFCVVSERMSIRPVGEQVAPAGWGSHRLHNPDGPAAQWHDGWSIYALHGVRVPEWVITEKDQPGFAKRALELGNSEQRRVAMEQVGWDVAVKDLGMVRLDACPDPGNDPHSLELYEMPEELWPEGVPVRLLLMTNASPDRDGTLRVYGETVPAEVETAIAAAAWQFGATVEEYEQLQRAT